MQVGTWVSDRAWMLFMPSLICCVSFESLSFPVCRRAESSVVFSYFNIGIFMSLLSIKMFVVSVALLERWASQSDSFVSRSSALHTLIMGLLLLWYVDVNRCWALAVDSNEWTNAVVILLWRGWSLRCAAYVSLDFIFECIAAVSFVRILFFFLWFHTVFTFSSLCIREYWSLASVVWVSERVIRACMAVCACFIFVVFFSRQSSNLIALAA